MWDDIYSHRTPLPFQKCVCCRSSKEFLVYSGPKECVYGCDCRSSKLGKSNSLTKSLSRNRGETEKEGKGKEGMGDEKKENGRNRWETRPLEINLRLPYRIVSSTPTNTTERRMCMSSCLVCSIVSWIALRKELVNVITDLSHAEIIQGGSKTRPLL